MKLSHFSGLPKIYRVPLIVLAIVAVGIIVLGVLGYVVMWLWNSVLAGVLDVPSVTFWQALGLFLLAKLFFGFGGGTQGSASRHAQHKARPEPTLRDTTVELAPAGDDLFKQYWREQGKQAYEAYLASKGAGDGSNDGT